VIRVRFFENRAKQRVAYVDEGEGELVVLPAWWVSHLERDMEDPAYARFFAQLASRFRVVRYDRVGVGLSDRARRTFTLESELDDFAALVDTLDAPRIHLMGLSCGGPIALAYAALHPGRVNRMVLYGSYLCGTSLAPEAVRTALIALVRANGRLGSRTLADIFHPTADAEGRSRFNQLQRDSADAETAARLLELTYSLDAGPYVDRVRAPVLVLHRKDDRAIAHEHGRTLTASLHGATLTTLPGTPHHPWLGDAAPVLEQILAYLGAEAPRDDGDSPARFDLRRDGEVWRLAAGGRETLLRDSKGLGDLARLIAHPGEGIHVLDLLGEGGGERHDVRRGDATLDRRAVEGARQKLETLDAGLAEADAHNDLGRKERLLAEREELLARLSADMGLRGKPRRLNDPIERARKAVTARLRDAILRVKTADPAVGEHLEGCVQTGILCTYTLPDRI
jgi:pimeloyl-ACP methyl ester carboxylesterase